jgi:hypothetical protein
MTIPEAVALVLQAGGMASGGEVFVLDMGQPVKIYDLAKNLIRLSGFEPEEDIDIEITGLRPGEKLYEELLMDEEGLSSTQNEKIFIAKPTFSDMEYLMQEIKCLKEMVMLHSDDVKDYIKSIVPTYNIIDDKREDEEKNIDEKRTSIAADVVRIRNEINEMFGRLGNKKNGHLCERLMNSSKLLCNGVPKVSLVGDKSKAYVRARKSLHETKDRLMDYMNDGIISQDEFMKITNRIDGTSVRLDNMISLIKGKLSG